MENSDFSPAYIYRALCFFTAPRQSAASQITIMPICYLCVLSALQFSAPFSLFQLLSGSFNIGVPSRPLCRLGGTPPVAVQRQLIVSEAIRTYPSLIPNVKHRISGAIRAYPRLSEAIRTYPPSPQHFRGHPNLKPPSWHVPAGHPYCGGLGKPISRANSRTFGLPPTCLAKSLFSRFSRLLRLFAPTTAIASRISNFGFPAPPAGRRVQVFPGKFSLFQPF
jgi:hypothetical protein